MCAYESAIIVTCINRVYANLERNVSFAREDYEEGNGRVITFEVNAKSIMQLLTLEAYSGCLLNMKIEGTDETANSLARLLVGYISNSREIIKQQDIDLLKSGKHGWLPSHSFFS